MKNSAEQLLEILDTHVPSFKESEEYSFLYPNFLDINGLICAALAKYTCRLLQEEQVVASSHKNHTCSTNEVLTSIFDTLEVLVDMPKATSKEIIKDELFENVEMFGDVIIEKFKRNLKPKSLALFEEWRVKPY